MYLMPGKNKDFINLNKIVCFRVYPDGTISISFLGGITRTFGPYENSFIREFLEDVDNV